MITPTRNQVESQAMAMEVMVALSPHEMISLTEPEQADHALTAWQVALRQTIPNKLENYLKSSII